MIKNWSRRKFIKTGIGTLGALFLVDTFWVEQFFIETNEFCLGNVSKANASLKVVQISDLHIRFLSYQLQKLALHINQAQPDLIVFTGDSIDRAKYLPVLDRFLQLLDHNIQKVAIVGNWEYWSEVKFENLASVYKKHNCELIINDTKRYFLNKNSVSITGIDDYLVGCADIEFALRNKQPSDYYLILNHCPKYNDKICKIIKNKYQSDLILSGHTHGGQVNLFGFRPYLPKGSGNYIKGWYEKEGQKIYVSKGIGTSMLPARFMSRSEIAVFYF